MTNEELWEAVLGELQLTVSEGNFTTFFTKTKLLKRGDGFLEIGCPDFLAKDRIENRFYGHIKRIVDKITHEKNDLIFVVKSTPKKEKRKDLGPLFETPKPPVSKSGLSPQYTFENFVVGPCNNLAHAVAVAIASKPGKVYNPFFLYSSVGLGKTHLVQAIGNEILKTHPLLKVVYCTGESFANELIDAIQSGDRSRSGKFRKKFRSADIWLIDDVQFIAGRETTQEEFFHTFNALYLAQKQIVLTSDRPPKDIAKLEERVSSRFSGGMMADMQPPDIDVRAAILRLKRDKANLLIPDEILDFIAKAIPSNIRDLEGAFLQVAAFAKNSGGEVTLELTQKVLGKKLFPATKRVKVSEILRKVATYYSLSQSDLKGKRRFADIVLPRQVAMYLIRTLTEVSLMGVGEVLGGRDHTTILHGVEKIEKALNSDPKIKQDIRNIEQSLEAL